LIVISANQLLQEPFVPNARLTDLLATTLGLVFTVVVCLVALHALLDPWLRMRRARAGAVTYGSEEKHMPRAAATRDASTVQGTVVHTS
jgi:hypothetical protein